MTLTSQLKNMKSPLSLFMREQLPHLLSIANALGDQMKGVESLPYGYEDRYPYPQS